MRRPVSLERRNETSRPYHRETAATPVVTLRFSAAVFPKNVELAIKAVSVSPRDDLGLLPCRGGSALIVSANSERGGRQ